MADKKIGEILKELKELNDKIVDSSIPLEDSIEMFEKSKTMINEAKEKLEKLEGTVKKIIDDSGKTDNF